MKLMFWKNQEAERNKGNELEDLVRIRELEHMVICIVLSIPLLYRFFKNKEKDVSTKEKQKEQLEWDKSQDKKSARKLTATLVCCYIFPFVLIEALEEDSLFFKFLVIFMKVLSSFSSVKTMEKEAESIVELMKEMENYISFDQLAVLILFSWVTFLRKKSVTLTLIPIIVPLLFLAIELVKAAAEDKDDIRFVVDESEGTSDLVESLTFLFFIYFWSHVDVNKLVKINQFEITSVFMGLLIVGFLLELLDVSFKDRFLPNDSKLVIFWDGFVFFYFWFNRMLFWPAYLLIYVFHPLSYKMKSFKSLGPCMLYLIMPVWYCSSYFRLSFLWYPWCPFTIIIEMNMAKDLFIEKRKGLEWYRNWKDDIFEVIDKQLKQNVPIIYLIKIESEIEKKRTCLEWPRLIKDVKEEESWNGKILEIVVPYEKLDWKRLLSNKEESSANKFVIIASCPHLDLDEVAKIEKENVHSVKLLEYDTINKERES